MTLKQAELIVLYNAASGEFKRGQTKLYYEACELIQKHGRRLLKKLSKRRQ